MQEQITDNTTDEKPLESAEVVDLRADIPELLREWSLTELEKENPEKITQNQYNAFLMDVHDRYIPDMELTDNRGYYCNQKALEQLLDLYIYLCCKFDKHADINGFSILSGIDNSTLGVWLVDKKASAWKSNIAKKLKHFDIETAKNMLLTGNKNPIGIMGYGNNFLGWSDKRITHQTESAPESLAAIADKIGTALPG